ncbi:MAG: UDP-N-acetylmuramoyl-L-alanine--D-glutamate ligase [Bacteroidales bacterium]|nr:UDP-N-acetylmuramoyl-L-alanine--D-glutamate ligase [Bacteroidales bacterium]MCF8404852.1 UDP-N-acetylmuramoyl-L-alanine--D-glutamate ligase [Bacteroidales bacterium]
MLNRLKKDFKGKKILLAGFGQEGKSSYRFLRSFCEPGRIGICDENKNALEQFILENPSDKMQTYTSFDPIKDLQKYNWIIKSPGIPIAKLSGLPSDKIISQTDIFLKYFGQQVIGITGTKGKSTTASLIYHILKMSGKDPYLVGNIGNPVFDILEDIDPKSLIVFEMSSHQLALVRHSPSLAVLLNLFEEHLDYYSSFTEYGLAKFNIAAFQNEGNQFIFNATDPVICKFISELTLNGHKLPFGKNKIDSPKAFIDDQKVCFSEDGSEFTVLDFSKRKNLPGNHNLLNILVAVLVGRIFSLSIEQINEGVFSFNGLSHRLEYLGKFRDFHFYNDSIATIPEATIEAIKTLKIVNTLILGGKDRGINYRSLVEYLKSNPIPNLVMMGTAGKRIQQEGQFINTENQNVFFISAFNELKEIIIAHSQPGGIVLLSPAASSYDMFSNFEKRGEAFKKMAEDL